MVRVSTSGAPPKRRRQKPSLTIATAPVPGPAASLPANGRPNTTRAPLASK
jgi:hypothetical protein